MVVPYYIVFGIGSLLRKCFGKAMAQSTLQGTNPHPPPQVSMAWAVILLSEKKDPLAKGAMFLLRWGIHWHGHRGAND